MAPSEDRATRRYGQRSNDMVDLVPPGWQLQPPDANWKGKRFLSPDGVAWFAAYATPVEIETVASHMKAIAFVDGETLTYLRGQEDWIAVSGFKGDRIIYRKAIIACAGKVWHHVAFEYPMALKREMDRFVISAADMIDRTKDTGCEDATSSTTPPTH